MSTVNPQIPGIPTNPKQRRMRKTTPWYNVIKLLKAHSDRKVSFLSKSSLERKRHILFRTKISMTDFSDNPNANEKSVEHL